MTDDDICGCEDTSSGEPCQWNTAEKGGCPWHSDGKDPDTRKSTLEKHPDLIDRVADRLASGDTVAEACAEVQLVSEATYYEWRKRGDEESDTVFAEFLEETTRARKGAGRQDRAQLQREIREQGDTRTWYKLHMKQYGDQYGGEEMDMREEGGVRQDIPEDLVNEWYERQN